MSILLTGFVPFGGEKINPSQVLVENTQITNAHRLILPVSYQRSFLQIKEFISSKKDIRHVVMLGQAGGRKNFCLEKVAINWMQSDQLDNDQKKYSGMKISEEAPDAFFTEYPVHQWVSEGQKLSLPVEVSFSAGAFVCNALSFQLAHDLKKQNLPIKWLFIHVPYLPEQLVGKTNQVAMELEEMESCLKFVSAKLLER